MVSHNACLMCDFCACSFISHTAMTGFESKYQQASFHIFFSIVVHFLVVFSPAVYLLLCNLSIRDALCKSQLLHWRIYYKELSSCIFKALLVKCLVVNVEYTIISADNICYLSRTALYRKFLSCRCLSVLYSVWVIYVDT